MGLFNYHSTGTLLIITLLNTLIELITAVPNLFLLPFVPFSLLYTWPFYTSCCTLILTLQLNVLLRIGGIFMHQNMSKVTKFEKYDILPCFHECFDESYEMLW